MNFLLGCIRSEQELCMGTHSPLEIPSNNEPSLSHHSSWAILLETKCLTGGRTTPETLTPQATGEQAFALLFVRSSVCSHISHLLPIT